ncbi:MULTISPECIES: hypothetical protein [unclassified Acinetobacter]|uniref:hypothetical protein n=1 Tax=unclassified Acinetobacter TaxID=196816 RepID=UPI0035B895B2
MNDCNKNVLDVSNNQNEQGRAMQAYKDFQQTGLHISLNEFIEWVDSLETDTPQEMPQCHQ